MMVKRLQHFLQGESAGGILLIVATLAAMLLANSPWQQQYFAFLSLPIDFEFTFISFHKDLLLYINDGLMALFFLQIGLEVKRELIKGTLNSINKALLPVVAALGGMLAPALIFLLFTHHDEVLRHGWAIPTATDIAFAVGILALLGSRVPTALKVFLLALAIIDDLGAIVIIALFYTQQLSYLALAIALVGIMLLALLNWFNVMKTSLYLVIGAIIWLAVLKSGIHATLAGVIVGFFIPLPANQQGSSPALTLEHGLAPWVTFVVLPLFAFANAGIPLQGITLAHFTSLLPLGIMAGLIIGKPVGVSLFCYLALKLKLVRLPANIPFNLIIGVSVLCGIGFTMSIFIATLSFANIAADQLLYAKLAILLGSLIAALLGYLTLYRLLARYHPLSSKSVRMA